MMLLKSKMIYQIVLVLFLQNIKTFGAPLPVIFQAQPQVIMHTLQQPIPIETFASLKTQKTNEQKKPLVIQPTIFMPTFPHTPSEVLQELAKIQAMQYSIPNPLKTQSPILTSNILNQIAIDNLQPTNSFLNQEIPIQVNQNHQAMLDYQNQVTQDAMQEIALQQQMLALQQMQTLNQLNTVQSPFGLYPSQQNQPVLILLPDEKDGSSNDLTKHSQNNFEDTYHAESLENEETDSVTIGADKVEANDNKPHKIKGMRKAILLIPNARFSIGGIISQIPWLPIEVNVPDTAIWAWNGIYNGISSIISIIGGNLPFGSRPPESETTEPSVKMFLKKLQTNDFETVVPVYAVPWKGVMPIQFQ